MLVHSPPVVRLKCSFHCYILFSLLFARFGVQKYVFFFNWPSLTALFRLNFGLFCRFGTIKCGLSSLWRHTVRADCAFRGVRLVRCRKIRCPIQEQPHVFASPSETPANHRPGTWTGWQAIWLKQDKGEDRIASIFAFSRDEATRTPDPYVPNVVRYQLRYIPLP